MLILALTIHDLSHVTIMLILALTIHPQFNSGSRDIMHGFMQRIRDLGRYSKGLPDKTFALRGKNQWWTEDYAVLWMMQVGR